MHLECPTQDKSYLKKVAELKKERDREQSSQEQLQDEIASTSRAAANLKISSPQSVAHWSPHEAANASEPQLEASAAASAAGTASTSPSTPPPPVATATTPNRSPVPCPSPLKQRERERERQREKEREREREREREEVAPLVDLAIEHEPLQQAEH